MLLKKPFQEFLIDTVDALDEFAWTIVGFNVIKLGGKAESKKILNAG